MLLSAAFWCFPSPRAQMHEFAGGGGLRVLSEGARRPPCSFAFFVCLLFVFSSGCARVLLTSTPHRASRLHCMHLRSPPLALLLRAPTITIPVELPTHPRTHPSRCSAIPSSVFHSLPSHPPPPSPLVTRTHTRAWLRYQLPSSFSLPPAPLRALACPSHFPSLPADSTHTQVSPLHLSAAANPTPLSFASCSRSRLYR